MSKTSRVGIVKSLKMLEIQAENLRKQADVELKANNSLVACQLQGKASATLYVINGLKPQIEFMRSEISLKKKIIVFLFVALVASVFFNFMQTKQINTLQDYNNEVLENVD